MPKDSHAKARALRIPLLKSHSSDRLAWYRNVLTMAAVAIGIGWLIAGYLFSKDSGLDRYSPGPLSTVHAQLECQDCHNNSAPMRDATFLSFLKQKHGSDGALWDRASDTLCKQCHPVADANRLLADILTSYPNEKIGRPIPVSPHTPNQKTDTVDSCASCHSEHRGADVLPSQVTDASCVACHQRLEDFRDTPDNATTLMQNVTRFDKDHLDFRALERDRGVLNFSHQIHMAPGVAEKDSQEILKIKPGYYSDPNGQLTGFTKNGLIQLECRFCHLPTDEPTIGAATPSSIGGQFMSMPSYENNCRVCHPLEVEAQAIDVRENPLRPQLVFKEKLNIEHGANSEKILNDLKFYFSMEILASSELGQQLDKANFNTIGKLPTRLWALADAKPELADTIRTKVVEVATRVRNECMRCHLSPMNNTKTGILAVRSMIADQQIANRSNLMFDTTIFKHARFDHSAHRDISCARCHDFENSVGKGRLEDIAEDKPMIKGLQSCRECHNNPAAVSLPDRPGPTSCVSCHTYHGGGNRQ